MLLTIFRGSGSFAEKITITLLVVITSLISLTVHEVCHGYAALKCGDPTARNLGRLSLDPTKHLDPLGTIAMLLFGFGWAKPVPINSRYFKNPRRDTAITAAAGPFSNFVLAFFAAGLTLLMEKLLYSHIVTTGLTEGFKFNVLNILYLLFYYFHQLNLTLAVFNLIPVPPLDGSRIFLTFLPAKYYFGVMKYEQYISFAIIILLFTGVLGGLLSTVSGAISNAFYWVWELLPFFGA